MSKKTWTLVLAAALVGGTACASFAGDGTDDGAKKARHAARVAKTGQAKQRHGGGLEILASLNLTDGQRRLVGEKARSAAPIVASERQEARRIIAQAVASAPAGEGKAGRKAARLSVRDQIKTIRENARKQLEPMAQEVVATLTPEQRAAFSAGRKKPLDDARLARIVGRLLGRPTTSAFLDARK